MFDFSNAIERLICHIRASCPDFAHVELDRVIIACMQARSPGAHSELHRILDAQAQS